MSSQPFSVDDAEILPQADGEADIVIVEEFQPLRPDELAIGQEQADARGREAGEIAPDEVDPDTGVAVAGVR